MYDYIRGKVVYRDERGVTVENNGIGYFIEMPNPYEFTVSEEEVTIYTFLHVREDIHALVGFTTREERMLFEKLITVSGIGPKGAIGILSGGESYQVVEAIEAEDEKFLMQFPGVGKKTARQIILDLKGKLDAFSRNLFNQEVHAPLPTKNTALQEALAGLEALGYAKEELAKVESVLQHEELTTEQYMKKAFQLLT